MSYNFKNLADVELLTEVPEGCTALAEVDGVVKRVPSKGLGGAGGIKTAIIKESEYNNTLAGVQTPRSAALTYKCINMTFEEAYQIMASGEPLACFGMFSDEDALNIYGMTLFLGTALADIPCIRLMFTTKTYTLANLYWTADGLSTEAPGGGGGNEES